MLVGWQSGAGELKVRARRFDWGSPLSNHAADQLAKRIVEDSQSCEGEGLTRDAEILV